MYSSVISDVVLAAGVAPIGDNTEQNKVLNSRVTGLEGFQLSTTCLLQVSIQIRDRKQAI